LKAKNIIPINARLHVSINYFWQEYFYLFVGRSENFQAMYSGQSREMHCLQNKCQGLIVRLWHMIAYS